MKKILLSVLGLLFLGVAGTIAWRAIGPIAPAMAGTIDTKLFVEATTLEVQEGQATVTRADRDPIKVTDTLELQEGDAIALETPGKAEILWSDGSVTRLGNGAEATITRYSVDEETGKQDAAFDLRAGEAWTKVLNVVQDDTSLEVRAQSTVAGIRGTVLYTASYSTGVIMMPFEHGVDISVDGTDTDELLLEDEGVRVTGTTVTKIGSGEVMNAFIEASTEADKDYVQRLATARHTRFVEAMSGKTMQELPDREEFEELFRKEQGTDAERLQRLGGLLDMLAWQMMDAQESGDTVRIATLTEYYEGLAPFLKEVAAADMPLRTALRNRMSMHMALLFSGGVTDDTFLARQAVARVQMYLMDENDDAALRRMLRREMFFASDLTRAGKQRQVDEVMLLMEEMFRKPLMENAQTRERRIFEQVSTRMEERMPTVTGGLTTLRRQLYMQKAEEQTNENAQVNDNQNMEEEPIIEEVTAPVRQTNTNTRVSTPTTRTTTTTPTRTTTPTTTSPTTTTAPKPTPTTTTQPTTTTNTSTNTAPKPTLVPAPVRTTTTTRPVLTPAQ